ncbi:MAG: S1C family serine protease [Anaerovoracaceae bacterium]|jgi:serine protease Do
MSISEDNNKRNENEEFSDSYFRNYDNNENDSINADSEVSSGANADSAAPNEEVDPASVNHGSTGTNSANESGFFGGSQYGSSENTGSEDRPFFGGSGKTYGPGSGSFTSDAGNSGYTRQDAGGTGAGGQGPNGFYNNRDLGGGSGYGSGGFGGSGGNGYGSGFGGPNSGQPRDFGDIYRQKQKGSSSSSTVTMTKRKAISLFVACMVLSGAVSVGAAWGYSNYSTTGSVTGSGGYTLESATGSDKTVSQIASQNTESVVEISTESVSTDSWAQQYVTEGAGSGIIIDSDGYIMTNYHVIEGASKITVRNDNNKTYNAEVVGYDEDNDIAVIKISATGLKAVTYGNSDQINVGDLAVIIGNPLGELGDSVTAGIISSTSREITLDNVTMNLIQTDASVNPGNSGGGLFNSKGQLIGVVVAKASSTDVEGLGFAIPVNKAAKIATQIIKNQ